MPCVRAKVEVKKIFDDAVEKAVTEKALEVIKKQVNTKKSKGLHYDDRCADGWVLTCIVPTFDLDDDAMEIKISFTAMPLKGNKDAFQGNKKRGKKGVDTDKLEAEAVALTEAAFESLMTDMVLPNML